MNEQDELVRPIGFDQWSSEMGEKILNHVYLIWRYVVRSKINIGGKGYYINY